MEGSHERRFGNIDTLRGVAALLVIWLHSSEVFVALPAVAAQGTAAFDIADLLGLGRMGVVAFFAISGYVIVPTVCGPRLDGTIDFLIKRFFRLFPPYWFAVAVATVTVWWLFGHPLRAATVAANLTMVPLEFGEPQMMGHFWTLEVELIFYAIVVALFWTSKLGREDIIAWSLLALSLLWPILFRTRVGRMILDHNEVWTFLSYFLSVMFWGAMLRTRMAPATPAPEPASRQSWPFLAMTALVFARPLLAITLGSATVNREEWRGTLLGLFLFLAVVRSSAWSGRPFVWIGTISYSLYLLHPAVFYPLFHVASRHPALADAPLWSYVLVSMIASVACASLAYRFIERPSIALSRRWLRRRNVRFPPPASAADRGIN